MLSWFFFCFALPIVYAKRLALTDSETPTPLLCTGSTNEPVLWGGANIIRWIHESQFVEVGARGENHSLEHNQTLVVFCRVW